MKLIIAELDVRLGKKAVINLCNKYNISYDICTTLDGGKYIECVRHNSTLDKNEYIDIYYNCVSNRKLYGLTYTQPRQFYVDWILEYFKKGKSE